MFSAYAARMGPSHGTELGPALAPRNAAHRAPRFADPFPFFLLNLGCSRDFMEPLLSPFTPILYYIILYYIILYYIVLYYIILYYSIVYYIIVYHIIVY